MADPTDNDNIIDSLLERYLGLLDEYARLRERLGSLQAGVYRDIARANYAAERGVRYGADHYDGRMRALRGVCLQRRRRGFTTSEEEEEEEEEEGEDGVFVVVAKSFIAEDNGAKAGTSDCETCAHESAEQEGEVAEGEGEGEKVKKKRPTPGKKSTCAGTDRDRDADTRPAISSPTPRPSSSSSPPSTTNGIVDTPVQTALLQRPDDDDDDDGPEQQQQTRTITTTSKQPPHPTKDPLRWFGLLTPSSSALREAQRQSVCAVEAVIPRLATVSAAMQALEIDIRRARKRRAKAAEAKLRMQQQGRHSITGAGEQGNDGGRGQGKKVRDEVVVNAG
ncbi:hypothetical protein F5Y17DRAFT_471341 [Xylariaceae sp. FL0594]|nr:hypothetical protein F5Y17DRAFT_471341 [Xylariaceae sp. FL0594]